MTRCRIPDDADPTLDPFVSALNDYRSMFGAGALPHVFLPADCMPTVARVLRLAVLRGRPVKGWTAARVCGLRQPPPGALI